MSRIFVNGREVDLDAVERAANGGQPKKPACKERRETLYGDTLTVTNLCADIDIQPTPGNEISVTIAGPEELVDNLDISSSGTEARISGGKSSGLCMGGRTISNRIINSFVGGNFVGNEIRMSSSGRGVHINGAQSVIINDDTTTIITDDDVVINTNGSTGKLGLKINVPLHTDLNLDDVAGDITIGSVQGDLELNLSGQSKAQVSTVSNLDCDLDGNCRVTVAKVDDDINLDLSGNCRVTVGEVGGRADLDLSGNCAVEFQHGCLEKLSVDASGHCKVSARVVAKSANLDASGMCTINVKEVTGRCRQDTSGMSRINIG